MSVKEQRDRLFQHGKPTIRAAETDDLRWLWAAARRSGYAGPQAEFQEALVPVLQQADTVTMLEDRNAEFAAGSGPVGLVLSGWDGWSLAPHVEWFPWASPRNKLRCTVAFLQVMSSKRNIGAIKISAAEPYCQWFERLKGYVRIWRVGKMPGGRPDGDEYLFFLRGRKQCQVSFHS